MHSPLTLYSPWTNGLVETQNWNLATHLRLILTGVPFYWSNKFQKHAYAHYSPYFIHHVIPYPIAFHSHPRVPLASEINLCRNSFKSCTSIYCCELPPYYQCYSKDLKHSFSSLLSKPTTAWLLGAKNATLSIQATVHKHNSTKLTSHTFGLKTTPEKQLPKNSFLIHMRFIPVQLFSKLKSLRLGPLKKFSSTIRC